MRAIPRTMGRPGSCPSMRSHTALGTIRKAVRQSSFRMMIIRVVQLTVLGRGYPLKKIQENNEAEIMQVVLDEARSSYPAEIVVDLKSEGMEDLEANVARIVEWIGAWKKDRGL